MKKFARILLLIVAIIMVSIAVPLIIYHWNELNALGWKDINKYPDKTAHLFAMIGYGMNALFAIAVLPAAIRGKCSFRLIIYAVMLTIPADMFFFNAKAAGLLSDWKFVVEAVIEYSLPLSYLLGTVLLFLSKR